MFIPGTRSIVNRCCSVCLLCFLDKILFKPNKNKAHGVDGFPIYVYLEFVNVLKESFTLLFNISLYCGSIPKV